jgi:hypothetical protein
MAAQGFENRRHLLRLWVNHPDAPPADPNSELLPVLGPTLHIAGCAMLAAHMNSPFQCAGWAEQHALAGSLGSAATVWWQGSLGPGLLGPALPPSCPTRGSNCSFKSQH